MDAFIRNNPVLSWKVVQRGFWVHGVDNLRAYLASAELFTMRGHAERIQCPTLITQAEIWEARRCRLFLRYAALLQDLAAVHRRRRRGIGHCEMKNRSLLNRRVLDWLDEQFGPGTRLMVQKAAGMDGQFRPLRRADDQLPCRPIIRQAENGNPG